MSPQSLSVGPRLYPSGLRSSIFAGGIVQYPHSYAWACPVCAEIWARASVPDSFYSFITHPCEAHEDPLVPSLLVPGSLLSLHDEGFNASLPVELWQREVLLHIAHKEKYE